MPSTTPITSTWALLLFCLALGLCGISQTTAKDSPEKAELELYAFLSPIGDKLYLNLRFTNLIEKPTTVLTKQPSLSGVSTNHRRGPNLGISYALFGTSSPGMRTWKFVPSLPDLAPVTLLKDETAAMSIELEADLAAVLKDPDTIFHIEYAISEDIAARFNLWHGKLTLDESVASLLKK